MTGPLFPGATAVSNLRVYASEASDHRRGGSPHLHTVSSEAYVVVAGVGEAHTITARAGAQRSALLRGELLWFSPGTIHRLVNIDGLEVLTVMQNIGLPEAGDAVLTFPTEVLAEPEAYAREAHLPDGPGELRERAAMRRRDLAVEGYLQLLDDVRDTGLEAMSTFISRAEAIVRPRIASWQRLWTATVEAETQRTRRQLAALKRGDASHLLEAKVVQGSSLSHRELGMCGHLHKWQQLVDAASPK